ncbi:MAG: GNAT family N-acetyltransferase [Bacteroidales bacterium]|nr:GNAT family N-acetyltransferase [Bacteroidales bacterium]
MIQIRSANEEDYEVIAGFQVKMAMETENFELDQETVKKGVLSVMQDPHKGKYFVAVDETNIVSSLLVTYEWSDWRNKWVLWIQSVYVLPEFRKLGIFRQMYLNVKEWAEQDADVGGVRLYVDKSNKRAIEVYKRLGMNGEHYQVFEWMTD